MDQRLANDNVDVADDLVTLQAAASMCGVSRRTVIEWANAGKLIVVVTPEGRCFRRSAIESAAARAGDDGYPIA